MSSPSPIGIFDSGVGGTSIWKEIHSLLPEEKTIYLADSMNAPYGKKSREEIIKLSKKNTERLLKDGAKMIVVACNTATTNAISELRRLYPVPFIGIEPAIKPAALQSRSKAIGILATQGTLSSELFSKASELYSRNIRILEVEGNGLVELIESGKKDSAETIRLLRQLLAPMLAYHIDCLVLGCSHYPYLVPVLKKILPKQVQIIDSGQAVARQTKAVLTRMDLLAPTTAHLPLPEFFSNKDPKILAELIGAEKESFRVSYLDF